MDVTGLRRNKARRQIGKRRPDCVSIIAKGIGILSRRVGGNHCRPARKRRVMPVNGGA